MPSSVPLDVNQRFQNAAWGVQELLTIIEVPAAASASLINQRLLGQVLNVNGDYKCLIPLSGITTTLQVHVRATFASGSVTTAGPDSLYYVSKAQAGETFTVKGAGTGDGALSTTVIQTSTLASFNGEQYALFVITIGGGASATFTLAEYNGL